jgi:serine phosphatase RsbU (regulator of sigma subunit)
MTHRILLVEDDRAILRGLGDNLRAESYEVLTACDGETAYRLMREQQPDLVVLDVMLPILSGFEVCRRVRGEGMTLPIVMLTAQGDEGQRVTGLDAGADDYVTKPFLLGELLARVRGLLRHRREWNVERDQLRRDVRSAAAVQQQLLPREKPIASTLDLSGTCRPALGIGGDYFDFIDVGPHLLGIVLADVAGKGIPAALTMASLHAVVRTEAPRYGRRCADLITRINAVLHGTVQPGRYATLFYGLYDDEARTLTYVNAGHPSPLVIRASASPATAVVTLDACVSPVGMFPVMRATEESVTLATGDWLVTFSDGVSEALDAGDQEFGRTRILEAVAANNGANADGMRDALQAAVSRHATGRPQYDDLTLVVGKAQ